MLFAARDRSTWLPGAYSDLLLGATQIFSSIQVQHLQSVVYYRCFQGVAAQLLMPLILQILIPTYSDDDGSALFWILDIVEYFMYCITIFLIKRVITSLRVL
ncbi:uncharacterized protein LOC112691759 isoform X1 [Sipha flava]|nr:uncharacterized protein LOC112691759 isoform X1 [Sipha flava]